MPLKRRAASPPDIGSSASSRETNKRGCNQRSRFGCTTCRQCKVKCDEERSSCSQCKEKCSYEAKFECIPVQLHPHPHPQTQTAGPTPPPSSKEDSPIVDPPEIEGPLNLHGSGSSSKRADTKAENCDDQTALTDFDSGRLPTLESGFPPGDDGYCSDSDAESIVTVSDTNFDFVRENGRKYHADVWDGLRNWEPLDNREIEYHALSHKVWTMVNEGRLFVAPVCNGAEVLDLGTGSGIWPIQFAEVNESCSVLGIDICPMQPQDVPPGVRFVLDNFDSDNYAEAESRYHYIHGRSLGGSVKDWPRLLARAFSGTKRGGWIELAEDSIRLTQASGHPDPMLKWWVEQIISAGEVSGKSFDICGKLKEWVEGAGFINVQEIRIPVPVGCGPAESDQLGMLNLHRLLKGLDGLSLRLMTRTLGMDANEVQAWLAKVRLALSDAHQVHQHFVIVIGQRP